MRRWALPLVAVAMAAAYCAFYTDWFKHPTIEIVAQIRPTLPGGPSARQLGALPGSLPVSFTLPDKYRINEIKVIANEEPSNSVPHVVWHLISDSASEPTKALIYGQRIKGMKPILPHDQPEPILPGVKYTVQLQAGRFHGEASFKSK